MTSLLWYRFGGRLVDFMVWLMIWYPAGVWISGSVVHHNLALFFVDQVFACLLMTVTEPLLLAVFGTTIGKALFGLRVLDLKGDRLTLKKAYRRTFLVWRFGLGFGLPFYRLVVLGRVYVAKREGEPVGWEKETSLTAVRVL